MFPGKVPGKFRESSGKVPGKFRESSGKVPGKFRKFRASSGNYGQVPKEDSGIGLALKFWQNPEFRKFRGSSGNSGEVPEIPGKFRRNSGQVPGKFRKPSGTGGDNHVAHVGVTQSSRNFGCFLFDCSSILQAVPEVRAAGFDSQLKNMRIRPTKLVATHGTSGCGRNHCKDRWGI